MMMSYFSAEAANLPEQIPLMTSSDRPDQSRYDGVILLCRGGESPMTDSSDDIIRQTGPVQI